MPNTFGSRLSAALLLGFAMRLRKKPAIGGARRRALGKIPKLARSAGDLVPPKPSPATGRNDLPGGTLTLTGRYAVTSQTWTLEFNKATLKDGLAAILALNKTNPFLLPGSNPLVEGMTVTLTWKAPVTGKSVYGHFLKRSAGKLGPQGTCGFQIFRPQRTAASLATSPTTFGNTDGTPSGTAAASNSGANTSPATAAIGANPNFELPPGAVGLQSWAHASFDAQQCWDIAKVHAVLEEVGFVVLRGFIPEHIISMAHQEARDYYLGVLKSFEHGFAVEEQGLAGFDKLADLPSFLWEHAPKGAKPRMKKFKEGSLGMKVDPDTKVVLPGLTPGGQAALLNVQPGWVVKSARAKAEPGRCLAPAKVQAVRQAIHGTSSQPWIAVRQPLAAWVHAEQPGDSEVTFKPPNYYSPLAVSQHWGCFTTKGYQSKLGLGKCSDATNFANCMGVRNAQLWMRDWLACMHSCLPTQLCWQPDGVSIKARVSFSNCLDFLTVIFRRSDFKSILVKYLRLLVGVSISLFRHRCSCAVSGHGPKLAVIQVLRIQIPGN